MGCGGREKGEKKRDGEVERGKRVERRGKARKIGTEGERGKEK